MEVDILSHRIIITKEDLINMITNKCKDDFISVEDLIKLIDKSSNDYGVVSQKKLIKSVKNYHTKNIVKDIYNILEDLIFESVSSTNEKKDVCIKLFEGISLDGSYAPEKIKKNNLTGETNVVSSRIKPKFNITRSYCEKLNSK